MDQGHQDGRYQVAISRSVLAPCFKARGKFSDLYLKDYSVLAGLALAMQQPGRRILQGHRAQKAVHGGIPNRGGHRLCGRRPRAAVLLSGRHSHAGWHTGKQNPAGDLRGMTNQLTRFGAFCFYTPQRDGEAAAHSA